MPDVVTGVALDLMGSHEEQGIGAIESLDLGLPVHAQHPAFSGGFKQTDDIAHLPLE